MLTLVLLILANVLSECRAGFHTWDHGTSPSDWWQTYPFCAGMNQSPVDICTDKVISNPTLSNIVYTNFNTEFDEPLELINFDGKQAQVRKFSETITIHEGGLPADLYILEELHFHVGGEDNRGSEHDIDGNFFPAEMHLVFRNADYSDVTEAKHRPQGLAVLSVLFEVTQDDVEAYQPIVEKLCDVPSPNQTTEVRPFKVRDLLPDDIDRFYRYRGSLTTPPCYQSVIWTIYKDTAKMSKDQLDKFRTCLWTTHPIYGDYSHVVNNFRPVQPLNGRLIEENKNNWSPIHCDNGNGDNDFNGWRNGDNGPKRRPARCDDRLDDDWWKEKDECYEDGVRNNRNNGDNNGRNNGPNNGRDNGPNNGRNNGPNNGRNNGPNNGRNNGPNNGRNNGPNNGRNNGPNNGKDNGPNNGRGKRSQ